MATISRRCAGGDVTVDRHAASSDEETNISLIYAFLPPLVRRSMPKVHSLRRSFNTYRSFRRHSRDNSRESTVSGRTSPPPAYHEALAPLTSVFTDDENNNSDGSASGSMKRASFLENDASGIQWKYASQGLNLLTLSAQESSISTSDPSFSRQLYIDATGYLLRGIPEDLNEEELISLRAAIPNALVRGHAAEGQLVLQEEVRDVELVAQESEPTVLHRIVAKLVFHLFIILSFLWPYVQILVRRAYEYERQHHISERFATQTWSTANAIGKRTVSTANLVCTWNDGQVGETLEAVVTWWIQGVAGGLCEGVGEGMEVLGAQPTMPAWRKGVTGRKRSRS